MFKNYAEAQQWIAEGQAKHGKKKFTSMPEYHAAYAEIQKLYKAENPVRTKRVRVEMPIFGCSLLLHAAGMR